MNRDGAAFSVMVGLGETYFAAFALLLGLGDRMAAYLATLPMLAGGLLQLATPQLVVWLGSCRRWVVLCAALQALSFAPLIAGAAAGAVPTWLLFACATAYWGFGMATGPAWNLWAEALVPAAQRPGHFARRARLSQLSLLAALALGGALLHLAGSSTALFAWLFAAAAGARLISTAYLSAQSEPEGLLGWIQPASPWRVWRQLRGSDAQRLLRYLLAMQVAVNVAAPFFTPYMLGPLALSYGEFALLTGAAFAARVICLPWLGRLAQSRGNRTLLRIGAIGIAPLPALWLVSDAGLYILVLQLIAGLVWAALELSTLLAFFEDFEPRDRASILAGYNLASALAMSAGTLMGGALMSQLGPLPGTYALLFLASSAGRVLSLLALRRLSLPRVALDPNALRTLAVRPSLGGVQRPVLATLPAPGTPRPDGEDEA